VRETREEAGIEGPLEVSGPLGDLLYRVGNADGVAHLKRVRYFRLVVADGVRLGRLPARTHERRWVSAPEVAGLPLVNEDLRALLRGALEA